MARRRRSRRQPSRKKKRAVTRRVQREVSAFSRYSDLLDSKKREYKDQLQDRRFFHPHDEAREIYDDRGRPATYRLRDPVRPFKGYDPTTARIGFSHPSRIKECQRRRRRRQVLFALKRTGKGAGASRRRQTALSKVRC